MQVVGQVEGRLESVLDGRAIGWAWDPERPDDALVVDVVVDGRPVAAGVADIERKMLADAGVGTGRYGFDIALPEELGAEPHHAILVTAGPKGAPLAAVDLFETTARSPDSIWQRTEFLPEGRDMPAAYVPEEEPPPDPGEAALIGKGGWLFLRDDGNLTAEELVGAPLLSEGAVEQRAREVIDRQRWMRELRIPYLFAVAPMKERLYPKFLPDQGLTSPEAASETSQ